MDTYNIHYLSNLGINIRSRRTGRTSSSRIIFDYNHENGVFRIWIPAYDSEILNHRFNNSKNADFVIDLIEGAGHAINDELYVMIEQIFIADFKEWLYE